MGKVDGGRKNVQQPGETYAKTFILVQGTLVAYETSATHTSFSISFRLWVFAEFFSSFIPPPKMKNEKNKKEKKVQ